MDSVYSLTSIDWANFLKTSEESVHVLPYLLDGLYKDRSVWDKHVKSQTKNLISETFDFALPEISKTLTSTDGTTKFQMRMVDGLEVETVLIPFHKKFTVCLSTQVGCGMNCSFCFTGTQGLKRNLTTGEIVGQYLVAKNWLSKLDPTSPLPNIVFMGQGEPLHNAVQVKKAIEVLNDPKTIGVGIRQMTLSTVGYLPGLKELASFPTINFALSLHSPFDEERNKLIPINQRFPLSDVMKSIDELQAVKKQFITYEYLLIQNFNMSEAHAEELEKLLKDRRALINLIPFNPFPGSGWERPSTAEIEDFRKSLVSKKLRVMVRTTKGDDILAACGQLKINEHARNYVL